MIPWEELDRVQVPGTDEDIVLRKRDTEFSIRTAGTELMNSRLHGSEDALAELACSRLEADNEWQILVGGLGMGFTLAATLKHSGPNTRITVVELIPEVVRWNVEHLGHLTGGNVLADSRVSVYEEDVLKTIREKSSAWDVILLDVDNGPEGLTRKGNDRLYGVAGLKSAFSALRPGGVLAVWSYGPDQTFTNRLNKCRFKTEVVTVRAHKSGKGARHTIWLATKP